MFGFRFEEQDIECLVSGLRSRILFGFRFEEQAQPQVWGWGGPHDLKSRALCIKGFESRCLGCRVPGLQIRDVCVEGLGWRMEGVGWRVFNPAL